jgi:hypothetical protein
MRWKELRQAAISLASLLVLYLLYASLVVPLIEPPAPQRSQDGSRVGAPVVSATDRYQADLAGLFAADAWEHESPKILRNRNTLLLFQDYQPQDDGTLRVFPCTAVILGDRTSDARRRASSLILQAPDGAVLQLSRPVDKRGTQFGQPVAGFLLGQIRIYTHGQPDGTGRLSILTTDVQIKPQMILTPHDVEFQYERSHARGRDLMIKLMPLKDNRKFDKTQGWAGVRSIELMHLEHLHLEIDDSSPTPSGTPPEATPVDVACQGPLRVDFVENVVTLEEQVELRRHTATGVVDTLKCQKLWLHLVQPTRPPDDSVLEPPAASGNGNRSSPPPTAGRDRNPTASLPKLEVAKVMAEGDPVVLDAPSRHARVRSRKLMYDLQLGRFQLWAAPDKPADQVHLQYDQQQMVARELDCLLDLPRGVRFVRATGPGSFSGQLVGSTPQPVRADWLTALVFERDGPLQRLTLDQGAEVQVGQYDGIQAEVIQLWLEPTPSESTPEMPPRSELAAGAAAREAQGEAPGPLRLSLRPHRVVALAHAQQPSSRPVRLRSEGVVATTQHLDAFFQHVSASPDRATDSANGGAPSSVRVASSAAPPRAGPLAGAAPRPVPARESRVFGRKLSAVLRVQERDVTVDHLVLQEDVRVQQFAVGRPAEPVLDLRADAVRMQDPAAQQLHTLTAIGQPVSIQAEKLQLQTLELNLDQARNQVWTRRPGRMTMLVDRDANGQPLAAPQEMTIDWQGSMDFDGLQAKFAEGVEVRSADQRLRGRTLHVQLTRKLQFSGSTSSEPIDIRHVSAAGNVLIETRQYEQQQLMSVAYLQVPFAQLDRQTGELHAGGPGRVITVREGFRGSLNPVAGPRVPVAEPSETDAKTFLQVDYQREITGNLHRKVVDFLDRVQVIYGPVLSWNETLSTDRALRKNDVLLSCDRLTVAQATLPAAGNPLLDLLAQGNTYVEGQTFTARGDRVSYAQSKELLVLEGTGRSDAVLSHQTRVGAPRSETAARKILYWVRTGRVEVDDARYLDLSNLGN